MVKNTGVTFEYKFDKVESKEVIQECLLELIKHVIFMRQQVPYPIITLENHYVMEKKKWNQDCTGSFNSKAYRAWRKLEAFVETFQAVADSIRNIINGTISVQKVVVILGSTIFTPKESIMIDCDTGGVHSNNLESGLKSKSCKKLLRTLIVENIFSSLKDLPPQKIFILICVDKSLPEFDKSEIFLPCRNFKGVTRGVTHTFNLRTTKDNIEDVNEETLGENCLGDGCENTSEEEVWYSSKLPLHGFR